MSVNKIPNDVDKHVGRRVRWRRRELNLSQEKLGELLGLTFQQIQKYEKGVNRISAGRLWEVAKVLECDIGYFYIGIEEMGAVSEKLGENSDDTLTGLIDADAVDLVTAFQAIPDENTKKSVLSMVMNTARAMKTDES